MTKYADAILAVIQNTSEHLTAEQVFLKLRETIPKVALATVYNNLNQLYQRGLIQKVSAPGCLDRYDRTTRHDHLICRRCGKLADIAFDDLTDILQAQLKERILSYDLQVRYICPECRKAEANQTE